MPFIGWPKHWVEPKYGFVWVIDEPAAIVTQMIHAHATCEGIEALHDVLDEITERGFLAEHPGLVMIHDWRTIKTYDANARDTWTRRSERRGKAFAQIGTSYIALSGGSLTRMAIQAGALAVQLATGQPPIRVIDDPAVPLETHGIRAPTRDSVRNLRRANPVR